MVREADYSGSVTLSSIALLQERFRQLQKMKELRQEKELRRTMMPLEQPPKTSPCSEQMFVPPPDPQCQLSLSLWPDSQKKNAESRGIKAPSNLAKSLFTDSPFKRESCDVDIDTSLHL